MVSDKKRLTCVLIGHTGCGKSTLLGHLLYSYGVVDAATMKAIEAEAAKRQRRSARYAMVVDREGEEWDRGYTTECKLQPVESSTLSLTMIDAPGKPAYQRSVVSGLAGVDAMILVVDATEGSFEEGMSKASGQTREHALLAYVLGIRNVIVAITKLDALEVPYCKERFDECKVEVAKYMKRVGFVPERIACVPVSGLQGDNLIECSTNTPWYKGPSLFEALDSLDLPKRPSDKPLRLVLYDVAQLDGGHVCKGRVEYGTLKTGTSVTFQPGGLTAVAQILDVHGVVQPSAIAGDVVGFTTNAVTLAGTGQGSIVSETLLEPARTAMSFVAQLVLLNTPLELAAGAEVLLDVSTAHVPCAVAALLMRIDRRSGKILEEAPAVLKKGDVAFCRMEPLEPVVVESVADYPVLGRFCLRHQGRLAAVGMVKSVEKAPFKTTQPVSMT